MLANFYLLWKINQHPTLAGIEGPACMVDVGGDELVLYWQINGKSGMSPPFYIEYPHMGFFPLLLCHLFSSLFMDEKKSHPIEIDR
jgi:hypothetical protein